MYTANNNGRSTYAGVSLSLVYCRTHATANRAAKMNNIITRNHFQLLALAELCQSAELTMLFQYQLAAWSTVNALTSDLPNLLSHIPAV